MKNKKPILLAALALATLGSYSCQKDNALSGQSVKQKSATPGTTTGESETPASSYDPAHPPTCPNHGG